MSAAQRISTASIVQGSYAFMRTATVPALTGTLIYAVVSSLGDFIRSAQVFGRQSDLVGGLLFSIMAIIWLAMSLRQGLGLPRKGLFGLDLGKDELRLGTSVLGFLFVLSIVLFLLGFTVFLLIMIVAVAGAGALGGEDVSNAELFTSPGAVRDFLSSGGAGTFVSITSGAILTAAILSFVWLILRLLPFAAAAIDQKRFVVLQAVAWTRYQDRALIAGGLLTIGVGLTFIVVARYAISLLPLPLVGSALLVHLASCFGALLLIGFICTVYTLLVVESDPVESE
ncbi:MAG: hypothetical protein AAFY34_06490 [Pseudomonadota bacterium]